MRYSLVLFMIPLLVHAEGPSFDCADAEGTVQEMICQDAELSALDREMAAVWRQVEDAGEQQPDFPLVRAEQRGWIKGRDDCWKSSDIRGCVRSAYRERIAELQARWRLVADRGPFLFACAGNPANEVVATFFATDPPTAILERGDQSVVCFGRPVASGARYEGRNVSFWSKGDEATVVWGTGQDSLRCQLAGRD